MRCLTFLICLGLAACSASGQQQRSATTHNQISTALRNNQKIVLVVAPAYRKQRADSDEAYGDWADGLNHFSAHAVTGLKIIRVTPASYSLAIKAPRIKGDYAVIFMPGPKRALLFDGMVLETKIYQIGVSYLQGHNDEKSAAAYGLQEVAMRLR